MASRGVALGTPAGAGVGLAAAVFVCTLVGCGTRSIKTKIIDKPALEVALRHQRSNAAVVDRGFQHPATISEQRLSYILGAIDVELREGKDQKTRLAAIHPALLELISRAMADAFSQANANQEVAVKAVRKQQRLGIFHKKFLTTLTAYFRDDRFFVHLSRVEWEIPKEREDKVMPEPERDERQMPFRAVPGAKMTQAGRQGLAVRWRDNLFSAPVRTASERGGARQERTILMESPIPSEELDSDGDVGLGDVEPEVLRALADLEEARRAGSITETEYQQRRENLLGEDGF